MTARDDIFIRIPAALDYGYDIVILYRTRPEMVAYVEFQLEILPPVHHGRYLVILPGVELYVRNRGKVVEIHIVEVLPVIEGADGHVRGLDDAQYSRLDHLAVEQCRNLFPVIRMLPVPLSRLKPDAVALPAPVDRPSVVPAAYQYPGAFQPALHRLELSLALGFPHNVTALHTLGTHGI